MEEFRELVVNTFDTRCISGLSVLKFQLLDHMIDDTEKVGSWGCLKGL